MSGEAKAASLTGDIQTDALILDIDGGIVPGLDIANPIPAVRAALIKLDPQFEHIGMVVQLTAKQDPHTDDVLRGRVYVLLSHAIHRLQQRWWQGQLAEQAPELNIDTGIMDSARVIYISSPIFVAEKSGKALLNPDSFAVKDPLEGGRWFLGDGPSMDPPAEMPNVSEVRTIRRASGAAGGGGYAAGLPYLSEGEELNIFNQGDDLHPRILAATFWLVIRGGEPNQVAAEVTDYIRNMATGPLRDRLNAEPGRLADIEKEVLDAARGAAEKFTSDRQLIQGVLPWSPRPRELSPEEGVAEVRRIVADVFGGELKRAMLSGAAGLGKSFEVAKKVANTEHRVDVYNPTHNLILEQTNIFRDVGCEYITVLSGRERSECIKAKAIGTATKNSDQYPLATAQLCGAEGAEKLCPAFDDCAYVQERIQAATLVKTVFRTSASLSHDPSWLETIFEKGVGKPEHVIVDEDFISSAISVISVPMVELQKTGLLGAVFHEALLLQNQGTPFLDAVEARFPEQRMHWCSALLPVILSCEDAAVVTNSTRLDEVVDAEWKRLKKERQRGIAAASMDQNGLMNAVEKAPGGYTYYELIRGVRRCLLEGHAVWNGTYESKGQAKVVIRHHMSRLRRRNQTVLMIDATANPLIADALLPKTKFVDICVRRNSHVIQVYDHTFSYKWLGENPTRLQDLGAFIRLHAKFMNPGVGHPKDKLGDMFDTNGLTNVTFGKERGINELEDCDIGFVVSRILPGATGCEEIARGLWPHDDLEPTGEYVRMPMGYNMRDGRSVGIMGWAHKDPRVNAVLRSKREAGLEQMLDRFRLIHNSEPKLVYVFTSQPFNVVVDELVTLDDAIGPARLMRLVEEYHPEPLLLSPKHLALKHPDLFKGVPGASKFCTQVRKWMAKNAWRSPVELIEGAASGNGGRRANLLRVRDTPIVVESEDSMRAQA